MLGSLLIDLGWGNQAIFVHVSKYILNYMLTEFTKTTKRQLLLGQNDLSFLSFFFFCSVK